MNKEISVTNYFDFIRWHSKYSHSVEFNMDRHGFQLLQEVEADAVVNGSKERWETTREIIETLLPIYGDSYKEFVVYRRQGAWGIPFVTVFGRRSRD